MDALKRDIVKFDGAWYDLLGNPSLSGSWIVWGQSANGKTRFVLKLCKYLTKFGRVAFNSCEEGISASLRMAFVAEDMIEVNGKMVVLARENYTELTDRLQKQRSPDIIVTDSLQYIGINYAQYQKLIAAYPDKLFIWISHADGKLPAGRVANKIRYDASVKIRVEGFKAFAQSRFGTTMEPYVIWDEGAERYWGSQL